MFKCLNNTALSSMSPLQIKPKYASLYTIGERRMPILFSVSKFFFIISLVKK